MQTVKSFLHRIWEKLLVLFGTLGVLLPSSPLNMPYAFRDSGVFLYIGWRVLNGELPYRDVWDHKPPVIFYINALGLSLSNGSRWGLWAIELLFLFLAAYLGFQLIKKTLGGLPAVLSLMLWLLSLTLLLQGGNITTEYALVFQFLALWLIDYSEGSTRPFLCFYFIGLAGALSFFTKQTTIGIWLAIAIYLTVRRIGVGELMRWVREAAAILSGGLTVIIFLVLFFGIQGALPQFWDAGFEYNFVYSSYGTNGFRVRVDSILQGLKPLIRTRILPIALVGYVSAVIFLLFKRASVKEITPLLLIGLINFPIELVLIGTPRKTYPPYYITALPSLAIFSALVFWMILEFISHGKSRTVKYIASLGLAGYILWSSFYNYVDRVYMYRKLTKVEDVVHTIMENTDPDDTVLIWGAETSVNFFSRRKSPTRFVYQYPLFKDGYATEGIVNEFLDDLLQHQPELIIDTGTQGVLYSFPFRTTEIDEKVGYLKAHYRAVQEIDGWVVYQYSAEFISP